MKTAESKPVNGTSHAWSPKLKNESFFPAVLANQGGFFAPSIIQPKLKIGKPGDKYEQQADRVADAVVQSPDHTAAVQRQPVEEEEEMLQTQMEEEEETLQAQMEEEEEMQTKRDPKLQTKCKECAKEENLQTKGSESISTTQSTTEKISTQLKSKGGSGIRLPATIQSEMSQKIGADFSGVNIHTDSEAAQMNQSLGARAFTYGRDIYFNKGEYNPSSRDGKHLLAHELTHVVQQSNRSAIQKIELPDWANSVIRGGGVAIRLTLHDEGSMYAKALMRHYLLGGGETFNPEDSLVNFPTDSMWSEFMAGRPEIQRRMLTIFESVVQSIHADGSDSGSFSLNVTDVRLNELESMRWTLHGAHRIEVQGDFRVTDTEPVRGTMAPSTRPTNPRVTLSNVRMVWVDVGDMHPGTVTETDSGETVDDAEFTAAGNSYPIRIPFEMPGESVWELRSGSAVKLRGWPNPSEATSTNYRE